jgi:hypothetical protein
VFSECASETLLGAKQDQRGPGRRSPADAWLYGAKRQGASDRLRDRRRIGVDGDDLVARLLRARGGDSTHGVDYAPQLMNA